LVLAGSTGQYKSHLATWASKEIGEAKSIKWNQNMEELVRNGRLSLNPEE